jgi:hypothetical protein
MLFHLPQWTYVSTEQLSDDDNNNNNNVLRPRVNPRKTSYYYYYTKYIYLVMVFHITTFNVSQALIIYITCISPILVPIVTKSKQESNNNRSRFSADIL